MTRIVHVFRIAPVAFTLVFSTALSACGTYFGYFEHSELILYAGVLQDSGEWYRFLTFPFITEVNSFLILMALSAVYLGIRTERYISTSALSCIVVFSLYGFGLLIALLHQYFMGNAVNIFEIIAYSTYPAFLSYHVLTIRYLFKTRHEQYNFDLFIYGLILIGLIYITFYRLCFDHPQVHHWLSSAVIILIGIVAPYFLPAIEVQKIEYLEEVEMDDVLDSHFQN